MLKSCVKLWLPVERIGDFGAWRGATCLHGDVQSLVIFIQLKGIDVLSDDGRQLEVAAGAGENWPTL